MGSFLGGFNLSIVNSNGTTGCARSSTGLSGTTADYIPHHSWPQYYTVHRQSRSTRGRRRPPKSATTVPPTTCTIFQDFMTVAEAGSIPAVSFIKAVAYQDGHAGYSNPLDEQTFVVTLINTLMQKSFWNSTAIVILYDDSDGWYDHQMAPIVNQSTGPADALTGPGACGTAPRAARPQSGQSSRSRPLRLWHAPTLYGDFALREENFVDHTLTDQTSVIRFHRRQLAQRAAHRQGSFDAIASPINADVRFHADSDKRHPDSQPDHGEPIQ
jgi:phospholipase C